MNTPKIRYSDLSFDRPVTGWLVISALVKGYYRTRKYAGYGKRAAARLFLDEVNAPGFE